MRQPRHQRPRVKLIHLLFKEANADHLPIGTQPLVFFRTHRRPHFRLRRYSTHCFFPPSVTGVFTPDIAASTSNMHAKSYLVHPMSRAAVRNSLLTAVVGSGTSSCRPNSIASTMSFCIMLTSNQDSSG